MEKKLILLAILRNQEMHGYRLSHVLEQGAGMAITLTKSNAYKLLAKMESDGWITYYEERKGKRPPRRVYGLTPEGEEAFQRLLRESMTRYPVPEIPSLVAVDLVGELQAEAAAELMGHRRDLVAARVEELEGVPEEVFDTHPSMRFLFRFYRAELEWMDGLLG
jgi:DNA-binding PadR family transcriptional regulator